MSNDFASMLQQAAASENGRTSTRLRAGQVVTGTVVQIGQDYVFVDVGTTTEGRIDRRELEEDGGSARVNVGDSIRASVISVDDVTGPRLSVSFGRGGRARLEDGALESARDARLPVEGVVGAVVKNGVGVEVKVMGARAFCPASQLGNEYIADLASLEGQKLEFLVLEVKNGGRDVIVSRKALLQERQSQAAAHTLATLEVGKDYSAKVVSLQKYGAFVDLGGVEGLIHISELAHGRVERVEDVLHVGEEITVRLLALQPGEKGASPKLRLSLRALSDSPPPEAEPERGEVLVGTISKVTSFGVFVDTAKGTGLVPTRELGTQRGVDARRSFPVGKEVSVVLVSKDASRGLTFSMSRVAAVEERRNYHEFARAMQGKPEGEDAAVGSFGALLQKLKLPTPVERAAAPPAAVAAAAPAARPAPAPAPAPARAPAPKPAPAAARAPAPKPAPAASSKPAAADRGNVDRSSRPRGPSPADRARVDRAPAGSGGPNAAAKLATPPDKGADLGVVRGRRKPGGEGGPA